MYVQLKDTCKASSNQTFKIKCYKECYIKKKK